MKASVAPHTGGRRRWMYGFRLGDGPSLEQVLAKAYSSPEGEDEGATAHCDSP